MQQGDVDHLLVNLRVDATMVKEQMRIKWAAETGLVDAIEPTVATYKEARGLQVRDSLLFYRSGRCRAGPGTKIFVNYGESSGFRYSIHEI